MAETVRLGFEHVQRVRYPPELLPFAAYFSVPAGKYASPAILDIKKLNVRTFEYLISLAYIAQPRDTAINLVYKVDELRRDEDTEALPDYPTLEEVYLPATEKLYVNYKNTSTSDKSYYAALGMWVHMPTVAEKIMTKYYDVLSMDISEELKLAKMDLLTKDEKELVAAYGLIKLLEKGTYPLIPSSNPLRDLKFKLEREYQVVREEVARTITPAIEGEQNTLLFDIKPNEDKGEFIVLTGIAPQTPPDATYGTQIWIERDEEGELLRFDCYPLSLDWYLPMWIVGITRMRVYVWTDKTISDWKCRIKFKVCRLNNILRARWFYDEFVSKYPELQDFADRVRLGVW